MKSLINISDSLLHVLKKISQEIYAQPIVILEQQTIGMQLRHIIEHWQILLDNYDSKSINYSSRKRDKTIENDIEKACVLIQQLQQQSNKDDCSLSVFSVDESTVVSSSYHREIDAVTEHIIHHAAIIKMAILSIQPNFIFPTDFGYAPATISYKEQCAQ